MSTLAPEKSVASVSLADADRDPEAFSQELGGSFERYGFAIVADHGIPADLIHRAEEQAKAFFALPDAVKRAYHLAGKGGARGYTPFGIETAKGAVNYDLKEFWHVARELPPGHKYESSMPPNVWPEEVESFKATFLELFAAFDATGAKLLEAIARYLNLAPDYFVDTVRDGNSILRLLHYPPIPATAPNVRAGAHEDINTDHPAARRRGGGPAAARPRRRLGAGDAAARRARRQYRRHAAAAEQQCDEIDHPPGREPPPERRGVSRYSMPFFLHFRSDFCIETLPNCISAERPNLYPVPITADEYLQERLREIKLV